MADTVKGWKLPKENPITGEESKKKKKYFEDQRTLVRDLAVTYVFNVLDLIFTAIFAFYYGIEVEGNTWALELCLESPVLFVLFKLVGVGLLLLLIYAVRNNKTAQFAGRIIMIVYLLLTVYHLINLGLMFAGALTQTGGGWNIS